MSLFTENTMKSQDWTKYFTDRLVEAEKELAGFELAVANHGLRVRHRDHQGERDVTDQELRQLEDAVEEYRGMLRDD